MELEKCHVLGVFKGSMRRQTGFSKKRQKQWAPFPAIHCNLFAGRDAMHRDFLQRKGFSLLSGALLMLLIPLGKWVLLPNNAFKNASHAEALCCYLPFILPFMVLSKAGNPL